MTNFTFKFSVKNYTPTEMKVTMQGGGLDREDLNMIFKAFNNTHGEIARELLKKRSELIDSLDFPDTGPESDSSND